MQKTIVFLPGDGVGPEILAQVEKVLYAVAMRYQLDFTIKRALIGGAAIDACNNPLPEETIALCKKADAIMLGAVGGPKWDKLAANMRPEAGLLKIRKELNLFANLRPTTVFSELSSMSCLRQDIVKNGLDILIVRELTGDVYFGQPAGEEVRNNVRYGFNNMIYNENEIRRIAHVGFALAKKRKKRLCSVDKANVLSSSRLWRAVVEEVHKEYADVELSYMYVDNCAMQLILNPAQFDVILTGNIFGDILSDEAAAVVGSLGMLPSASLRGLVGVGDDSSAGAGIFEPIHGSAPDIAGMDRVNPLAAILSAAMMLHLAFSHEDAALAIENAVRTVLQKSYRTNDIAKSHPNPKIVGCQQMGDLVVAEI